MVSRVDDSNVEMDSLGVLNFSLALDCLYIDFGLYTRLRDVNRYLLYIMFKLYIKKHIDLYEQKILEYLRDHKILA